MSQKTLMPAAELRKLPSIDSLLQTDTARSLRRALGAEQLSALARRVTDELRQEILANSPVSVSRRAREDGASTSLLAEAEKRLATAHRNETARGLRRVINATGVILHTNLGRAPLSEAARRAIADTAGGYCTLEYDIAGGSRGRRGARAEDLLASLTGAEASLVVNNCAAAALLALTVLAHDGETIVSRGELVEIGGDFRVPEVMAQSGTRMIEVGTTNRTKLSDYRKAISENTRLIMRVHTSNYRIVGFTKTPSLRDLAGLAHDAGRALYEDAGSGALVDFNEYQIAGEPVIRSSIKDGADIVSFSGDKLLGGPQAGLVVGRADLIDRMRSHPLYRALRADKLALAALQATLEIYRRDAATEEIPVHRMLALTREAIEARSERFLSRLRERLKQDPLWFEIVTGQSAIGGGAAPTAELRTALIALRHSSLSPDALDHALRQSSPPIIARIVEDKVLLDLRTVDDYEEDELLNALVALPA